MRRIPDRLLPHQAAIAPYTGPGVDGLTWAEWGAPVRANFNPLTARGGGSGSSASVTVNGVSVAHTGTLFVDVLDLPLLSKVRNTATGQEYLALTVKPWSHPDVATFLEVLLGDVPVQAPGSA